jgi:hypothetical protein
VGRSHTLHNVVAAFVEAHPEFLREQEEITLVLASDEYGTTRFWDVESGAEKGQELQGTHGESLEGELFTFSKSSSTKTKQDHEVVVGSFIVNRGGKQGDDLVLLYEVVLDKKTPVAGFFEAPSTVQSLVCAGDKIAVGLQKGDVRILQAAFLVASE